MQPSIEHDLSQMPTAYDYPHLIALFVVVVAVTSSVGIWSARKRGEIRGKGSPLSLMPFLILVMLHVSILYLLPAMALLCLIKLWMLGIQLSPGTFVNELFEPASRIAVIIGLLDNYADACSVKKRVSFGAHCVQFLIIILPAYYGLMGVAWLLARVIAAGGGFDPVCAQVANGLFSVPRIHTDPTLNIVLLVVLVLLAALISYGLRVLRAGSQEEQSPVDATSRRMKAAKPKGTMSYVEEALRLERGLPGHSLFLYRCAEKLNTEFSKGLFVATIVAPILASALAFFTTARLEHYRTLTTTFIIAVFGFGLPVLFLTYRDHQQGIKVKWYHWLLSPFTGFYFMFATLWTVVLAGIMGVLTVLPIGIVVGELLRLRAGIAFFDFSSSAAFAVRETSMDYVFPFMVIVSFIIIALLIVDLHPNVLTRQPIGIRILGAGLVLNSRNVASFVAGLAIGAVLVGTGPLGLLYDHLWEGLLSAGLAGALLGHAIAQRGKDAELDNLIILGRVRCNVRCRRSGFARYPFSPNWGWILVSRPYVSFPTYSAGERLKDLLSYLACPDEYKGEEDLLRIEDLLISAKDYAMGNNGARMRALKELERTTEHMSLQHKKEYVDKILCSIRETNMHHRDLWLGNVIATRLLAKDQHALWRKGLLPR